MFSLNDADGWSLLEVMDSAAIAQRMSRVQGWALLGKICECVGGCEDLEAVESGLGAGTATWSSSLDHRIHICQCHSPILILDLVCVLISALGLPMAETQL